jgi:methionyl-tRNA synthetase
MIHPYMPHAAEQIASFFGLSFGKDLVYCKDKASLSWDSIGKDEGLDRVIRTEVLFTKLEDEKIQELRERYSGTQKDREAAASVTETVAPVEPVIEPPEIRFAKTLDLRVAKIAKIARHPKADKLYVINLEVSEGKEETDERTIVSGLVPFYKEEDLLGKRIIVAYNLKPARLRGIESRGMLLAAEDHCGPPNEQGEATERCEVLNAHDAPLGTRVTIDGIEPGTTPPEIDIETFFSIPMEVKDNVVQCGGKALFILGKPINTGIVSQGEVH